jgi:hypothetical protein
MTKDNLHPVREDCVDEKDFFDLLKWIVNVRVSANSIMDALENCKTIKAYQELCYLMEHVEWPSKFEEIWEKYCKTKCRVSIHEK